MKVCTLCKRSLPLTQFNKGQRSRDGLTSRCKTCLAVGKKKSYARHRTQWLRDQRLWYLNGGKQKMRDAELRLKYNMTLEEYEALVADQDGKCRICQREAALSVDHDHASGLFRGLLCNPCNLVLGIFEDDPSRFLAAATYLAASHTKRSTCPP